MNKLVRTTAVSPEVVFLPFAGAHRNSYSRIQRRLEEAGVASSALEAPGRGSRFGEECCTSFDDLLEDMSKQLRRTGLRGAAGDTGGIVLAGHSMGALLAWQLAVRSARIDAPVRGLFLSGRGGPGTPRRRPELHALPDDRFIHQIGLLGGCPEEILRNSEMMELMVPILRADFRCVETLPELTADRLDVPVQVLVGSDDSVTCDDARAWSRITTYDPEIRIQPGGHFHILDDVDDTVDHLLTFLERIRMTNRQMQQNTLLGADS